MLHAYQPQQTAWYLILTHHTFITLCGVQVKMLIEISTLPAQWHLSSAQLLYDIVVAGLEHSEWECVKFFAAHLDESGYTISWHLIEIKIPSKPLQKIEEVVLIHAWDIGVSYSQKAEQAFYEFSGFYFVSKIFNNIIQS